MASGHTLKDDYILEIRQPVNYPRKHEFLLMGVHGRGRLENKTSWLKNRKETTKLRKITLVYTYHSEIRFEQ